MDLKRRFEQSMKNVSYLYCQHFNNYDNLISAHSNILVMIWTSPSTKYILLAYYFCEITLAIMH